MTMTRMVIRIFRELACNITAPQFPDLHSKEVEAGDTSFCSPS